ncbi:MAG: type II toxin-antitoxin system HicB family antitoxin [Fimbriimonadaceae bacterium]
MKQEYVVLFEPDEDRWVASVPDLPGCFSDAKTLSGAQSAIREAIRLWLETARANDWPIPKPQATVERIAI